jgi:hypothetical protein
VVAPTQQRSVCSARVVEQPTMITRSHAERPPQPVIEPTAYLVIRPARSAELGDHFAELRFGLPGIHRCRNDGEGRRTEWLASSTGVVHVEVCVCVRACVHGGACAQQSQQGGACAQQSQQPNARHRNTSDLTTITPPTKKAQLMYSVKKVAHQDAVES